MDTPLNSPYLLGNKDKRIYGKAKLKEIKIIIRINNKKGKMGFIIEDEFGERISDTFEMIGILEVIKSYYLDKLYKTGEIDLDKLE